MDSRQKRQATAIVVALMLGVVVSIWMTTAKSSPEELAIREAEYLEQQRKAAAETDRAALQSDCEDQALKVAPSGLVAKCVGHRWVIPIAGS